MTPAWAEPVRMGSAILQSLDSLAVLGHNLRQRLLEGHRLGGLVDVTRLPPRLRVRLARWVGAKVSDGDGERHGVVNAALGPL